MGCCVLLNEWQFAIDSTSALVRRLEQPHPTYTRCMCVKVWECLAEMYSYRCTSIVKCDFDWINRRHLLPWWGIIRFISISILASTPQRSRGYKFQFRTALWRPMKLYRAEHILPSSVCMWYLEVNLKWRKMPYRRRIGNVDSISIELHCQFDDYYHNIFTLSNSFDVYAHS